MYELLLKHIASFVGLDPFEQQTFCTALEWKPIGKHQFLLQEGEFANAIIL